MEFGSEDIETYCEKITLFLLGFRAFRKLKSIFLDVRIEQIVF